MQNEQFMLSDRHQFIKFISGRGRQCELLLYIWFIVILSLTKIVIGSNHHKIQNYQCRPDLSQNATGVAKLSHDGQNY